MQTPRELAAVIDHTLLRPHATRGEVERLCSEAAAYRFKTVCVNPVLVADAVRFLRGTLVGVCSVAGFPLGTHLATTKAHEAREAVRAGAAEIDMVIRIGALREGDDQAVLNDIRAVVEAADSRAVKVILETCYLTEDEKMRACILAVEGGASFVKTSTGYGPAGAAVEDVTLMRRTVGENLGVKAAGGIRTLADAFRMIQAGANRLGMSGSVAILKELERQGQRG
ncbi:MAG: deoxyribose-phosphate aldolase [Nitrospirota bacterium]